ncbi:MAG: TVP38/TMEM64 family protein [Lachnospiraceae bacterium]|nr:TVP38/TMEM64 family protein [Lachnospiraceae bacterium]
MESEQRGKKLQKTRKVVRVILIILALLFCAFLGYVIIKFATNKDYFKEWMINHGLLGCVIYMIMVVFQVIVALVPGEPVEIAGGYAFGAIQGTLLYLIGSTIGSMIVFLLVRKYGTNLVEMMFSNKDIKGLDFLRNKKREALLILLFVIPGTPKDLLCYFAGLTTIKVKVWIMVCSLGRIPSIVTSTIGGDALERSDYVWTIVAFSVAFVISVAGILVYRTIQKKHNDSIE